ncbi:Biotin carboxyl carrier protein of acetyl-CoA carboxylase (BCCP) [Candidatus Glomeribacter gigasporarum BEG34]|uniref:Biotin carboxyl carrier protein of acetyl-CoA carboxylase n=1 Tax=Candidatus Glomeribacter gigasporarum BEG34 TaxID=1070319 RepID=G2J8R6_9BURK|nr:acetyl-CoA carboxylase biotin carboxyl carrier protein [Candidatus Glomeribacter gigasporarum]CCD29163.1 Biotin carboxyl carrier protein of acetyl-CoA carboxylase (BCCP) [Candidatus Glomeribacter gigasporarum BEG34]
MDLRKLKTLIDLVAASGISELEMSEGEDKVRIVKDALPAAPFTPAQTPPHAVSASDAHESASAPPEQAPPQGHVLTSPMVGTFYRAPSPEAAPFVQVGDPVEKGQTIGIIEAMKLLNEIEADEAGIVKEFLVENGQAVEYGQPLLRISA